jgi:hypothetical protein
VSVDAILEGAFDSLKGSSLRFDVRVVGEKEFGESLRSTFGREDPQAVHSFTSLGSIYIARDRVDLSNQIRIALAANARANFANVLGYRFTEGTGAILTQTACRKFNIDAPVSYPEASSVVQAALDAGLPFADLVDAYFNGGAEKIAAWVDVNCAEKWAKVKEYLEGSKSGPIRFPGERWDQAKKALRRTV